MAQMTVQDTIKHNAEQRANFNKANEKLEREKKANSSAPNKISTRLIYKMNNEQIANMIFDMAKNNESKIFKFDMLDTSDMNKIGRKLTKKISSFDASSFVKEKLYDNVQRIMKSLSGQKTKNPLHNLTRNQELGIVVDEYITAAKNYLNSDPKKSMTIKRNRYPVIDVDKEKYKGAINFNKFSVFEIRDAVIKSSKATITEGHVISEYLKGKMVSKNQRDMILAEKKAQLYSRSI